MKSQQNRLFCTLSLVNVENICGSSLLKSLVGVCSYVILVFSHFLEQVMLITLHFIVRVAWFKSRVHDVRAFFVAFRICTYFFISRSVLKFQLLLWFIAKIGPIVYGPYSKKLPVLEDKIPRQNRKNSTTLSIWKHVRNRQVQKSSRPSGATRKCERQLTSRDLSLPHKDLGLK